MYCQKCGKPIADGSDKCLFCGEPIPTANIAISTKNNKTADKKKNRKVGCLCGAVIIIAVIAIFAVIMGSGDSTIATDDTSAKTAESQQAEEDSNTYKIGDTVTVHSNRGDYSLKFTGVRETKERNPYADEKPQRVIVLEYEYKNISFDADVVVSYLYFRTYDKDGNALSVYPDTSVKQTTNISQGKTTSASCAYGLNSNDNSVTVDFYDITMQSMNKSECSFTLTW